MSRLFVWFEWHAKHYVLNSHTLIAPLQPYLACSSDSTDGFCGQVDTSCSAVSKELGVNLFGYFFFALTRVPLSSHAVLKINTCRTCDHSGNCYAVEIFPNASIAEYGTYSYYTGGFSAVADKIKAEIYARGPVATGVNAEPLLEYSGGVVYDTSFFHKMVNHIVSIVGWDTDPATGEQYWIVRNSWYVSVLGAR